MDRLLELASKYKHFDDWEKRAKKEKDELKQQIKKELDSRGAFSGGERSYKNSFLSVTYTAKHEVDVPDVDKMKDAGVWEFYLKRVERAGSLRVSVKEKELDLLVYESAKKSLEKLNKEIEAEKSGNPDVDCRDVNNDDDLPF